MVVLSKARPLTARYLSPLPEFRIPAWACEKVASDLGLGSGYTINVSKKQNKSSIQLVFTKSRSGGVGLF